MRYRIELADRSFNKLEDLTNEAINPSWDYSAFGGCGSFSFSLPRRIYEEKAVGGKFNIKIYVRDSTNTYQLRYQGMIQSRSRNLGTSEDINITGHGYVNQLKNINIRNVTYTSTEAKAIVVSLLDTYVTPYTDITYSAGDLEATSFTFDSIKFNNNVFDAIETIAETVGNWEWGVAADRTFYFKQRSTTVSFRESIGARLTKFQSDESFDELTNRVVIIGGDVSGSPYEPDSTASDYNDTASQTKYGRHDKVIQNSAIRTSTVAVQFAQAHLSEYADVIRRGSADIVNPPSFYEETTPIDLFRFITRGTRYGEAKFDTFQYSGLISYQINRIAYSIDDTGNLLAKLDLSKKRASIAEVISRLKYQIEQLSRARL